MKHLKHIVFALLGLHLLFCNFVASADVESADFGGSFWERHQKRQIGMKDGLRENYVDHLIKDNQGFLWIATQGAGLMRYDGYNFLTFDVQSAQAIRGNYVKELGFDAFNRLWVATDQGLDVINLSNYNVITSDVLPTNIQGSIGGLVPSQDGMQIWVYSDRDLYAVCLSQDGSVKSIENYRHDANFNHLQLMRNGNIVVANGLHIYEAFIANVDTGVRLRPMVIPMLEGRTGSVSKLFERDDELWIGTTEGLYRINRINDQGKIYRHSDSNPMSLSQDRITDIALVEGKNLCVSTLKGLNIYDPMTDSFERILSKQQGDLSKSLSCNFINCMYPDGDILWLATEMSGIDIIIPNALQMVNYVATDSEGSISRGPVNAIIEDWRGTLWVGCVEGGLNQKMPNSNVFRHYTAQKDGMCHNSVSCLAVDPKREELWVGTWGGGVDVFDIRNNTARKKYHLQGMAGDASMYIGAIIYDAINDGMWIATVERPWFVKDGMLMQPFQNDDRVQYQNGSLGIMITDDGFLWLGLSKGLLVADLSSFRNELKYEYIDHKLDDPNSTLNPRITNICQAKNGDIYVASNGYGIFKRRNDVDGYQFEAITVSNGLCSNSVKGIAEDDNGNIWITTAYGLSKYDPYNGKFTTYTQADGLLDDIYYWNGIYSSEKNHRIYLGASKGLVELQKVVNHENKQHSHPFITEVRVLGQLVTAESEYFCVDKCNQQTFLRLHESDKQVSFTFASLQFQNPDAMCYQYRLVGFDEQWVTLPAGNHQATYTNLPAYDYVLEVRCNDDNGEWSEPIKMNVCVSPYFYKTIWFYCLIAIICFMLIYSYNKLHTKNLKEQQRLLNMQVEERTQELRERTKELERRQSALENQNVLLAKQNEQIKQQNADIQDMSSQIEVLTQDKLQFFTNISHELRTPITLIMGPIERALKMTDDPKVQEQLQFCQRNSKYLLQLVNQLMDFRKMEEGSMELKPVSTRIKPFVSDLVHPFSVYASERDIKVELKLRFKDEVVKFCNDSMNKVLTNLIGNAVKFTPNGGHINVYMAQVTKEGKEHLYLSVEDNGVGVPENELKNIFERFYQSDNHLSTSKFGNTGTGIGLFLCKRLVDAQGGDIYALNNHKGGCTIRAFIPFVEGDVDELTEREEENVEQSEESVSAEMRPTVLIVEDNADMRQYIRSIVTERYNVVEAADGLEGLTRLAEHEVDFIVCDLMMPVMDGMELVRRVKSDFSYSHIPIIILTAQLSDEYRTKSYQIGVESYLQKPFDADMLMARISGILDVKKQNQVRFSDTLNPEDLNIEQESDNDKFVRRVMNHIKEHYSNPDYMIEDIIRDLGCSKSMLNKKMQSVMGQPPGSIIRTYRLTMAKQMLSNPKRSKFMNISQVAYDVGFNDPKYFTRCFTKYYGITPSALFESKPIEEVEDKKIDIEREVEEEANNRGIK